jgi:hypothetical protein
MQGTLTIGRLAANCHVVGPPLATAGVADRAARALRDHLPRTLRDGLGHWLDRGEESVWIVRRLDLSILTAADAPPDDLATGVAAALGRALAATLSGDGDGMNAIRFPRRAVYVAQFAADLAGGDAWRRWYYAPFSGLQPLPASAAIRTVLTQDPEVGRDALHTLDDRRLSEIARCLTTHDERAVIEACAALASDAAAAAPADLVAACARASRMRLPRGRALVAIVRARAAVPPSLLQVIEAILEAFAAVDLCMSTDRAAVTTAVRRVLAARLPERLPQALRPLAHQGTRLIVDAALGDSTVRRDDGLAIAPPGPLFTRFGGIGLLLRDLDALPWTEWTSDWPVPPRGSAATVLKWLTACVCAGHPHVRDMFADDVWRGLFGVPSGLSLAAMSSWLRDTGPVRRRALLREASPVSMAAADRRWLSVPRRTGIDASWSLALSVLSARVFRRFAARLPGFADSTAEYLWRNVLDFDATVEIDGERVVVQCGRPPLHLVLTITGMTRGLEAGLDAEGRSIVVFARG